MVIADKKWSEQSQIRNLNSLLGELVLGSQVSRKKHCGCISRRRSGKTFGFSGRRPNRQSRRRYLMRWPRFKGSLPSAQVLIRDESGIPVSRADFAFEEIKYAVYCDGRQWHLPEDRWEHDLRQRNKLAELGWSFSVFTGRQIKRDATACTAQVLETYTKRLESLMRHEPSGEN